MCAYRHCKTESFHLPLSATFTYFVIFRVSSQAIIGLCLNTRPIYSCNNLIEREPSFIHYRNVGLFAKKRKKPNRRSSCFANFRWLNTKCLLRSVADGLTDGKHRPSAFHALFVPGSCIFQ